MEAFSSVSNMRTDEDAPCCADMRTGLTFYNNKMSNNLMYSDNYWRARHSKVRQHVVYLIATIVILIVQAVILHLTRFNWTKTCTGIKVPISIITSCTSKKMYLSNKHTHNMQLSKNLKTLSTILHDLLWNKNVRKYFSKRNANYINVVIRIYVN